MHTQKNHYARIGICAKYATKGNCGLSCTKNTFQKEGPLANAVPRVIGASQRPPNAMHLCQSYRQCKPLRYTPHSWFHHCALSPQLLLLVQIPNLTELIQTSDVEVRSEQRAEHRLSAWQEICFHFPSIAVELEDIHVFVIISKLILILFIMTACAIHLCAFYQRLALGFVAKTLQC